MSFPIALLKSESPRNLAARISLKHPWIFSEEVANLGDLGKRVKPGSIVNVQTPAGVSLGFGTLNRAAAVAVRLMTSQAPDPRSLILKAVNLRKSGSTRLVNGEVDSLPGLFVDRNPSDGSLTAHARTLGATHWLPAVCEIFNGIEVQLDSKVSRKERSSEEPETDLAETEIARALLSQKIPRALEISQTPDFSLLVAKKFPGSEITHLSSEKTEIDLSNFLSLVRSDPPAELRAMADAGLSFPAVFCRPPQPLRNFQHSFKSILPYTIAALRLVSPGGRIFLTCAVAKAHEASEFLARAAKDAKRKVAEERRIVGVSEQYPRLAVVDEEFQTVTVVGRVS